MGTWTAELLRDHVAVRSDILGSAWTLLQGRKPNYVQPASPCKHNKLGQEEQEQRVLGAEGEYLFATYGLLLS